MVSLLGQAAGAASGALLGLFGYNRENYQFDRRQRLLMEFQQTEMRIEQTKLWREDVRSLMELTPRKMQNYLVVIALELNASACALCKARVPPGSPTWLAACHTLSICTCMTYLFLALWFGLHAFVAAQAYKVRILTQIVRLPIPTFNCMEAMRTYMSSFEKLGTNQMFRVPYAQGSQESQCKRPSAAAGSTSAGPGGASGADSGAASADLAGQATASADPWGLERPANFPELQPGVNANHVERQQHIWQVREAMRFYTTYDAFCRVCLGAGTSSLASFFSFFCLSYVLTENAAPVAAWAGMLVFSSISVILIGNDMKVTRWQFLKATLLLVSSPILCSIVTFASSRNFGNPGRFEWLMPVAFFNKGLWFVYYLYLFRVKEMQTGAVLPQAFRGVLYVDPFGWAKHTMKNWRNRVTRAESLSRIRGRRSPLATSQAGGLAASATAAAAGAGSPEPSGAGRRAAYAAPEGALRRSSFVNAAGLALGADEPPEPAGWRPIRRASMAANSAVGRIFGHGIADPEGRGMPDPESMEQPEEEAASNANSDKLPSMVCVNTAVPTRPEDADPAVTNASIGGPAARSGLGPRVDSSTYIPHVSFRPATFTNTQSVDDPRGTTEPAQSGVDIHGEIPGLVPWRYFFINTMTVALLWWVASAISVANIINGSVTFVEASYGLAPGEVAPLPDLLSIKVETGWHGMAALQRPQGLACDASGSVFATSGRDASGRRAVLHGRLSQTGGGVRFAPSLEACGAALHTQDLAIEGRCGPLGGGGNGSHHPCRAVLLPRRGGKLGICALEAGVAQSAGTGRQVGQAWLEDRGGAPTGTPEEVAEAEEALAAGLLQPEELSALTLAPCASTKKADGAAGNGHNCVVVATTARRVVLLGESAASQQLVPRRLLRSDHDHVPEPGSLALLDGRFLGVLDKNSSSLRVMDLHRGGHHVGSWRLSRRSGHGPVGASGAGRWSSICAGGGSFFGLEDGEQPSLWRFPAPRQLLDLASAAPASAAAAAAA